MAAPNRKRLLDIPVLGSWSDVDSVHDVKRALRSHEGGEFVYSSRLFDFMTRDDRLAGAFETRIGGLLTRPLKFETKKETAKSKEIAQSIEDDWWDMYPESSLSELVHWGISLGIGVGEQVYATKSAPWKPQLKIWHPQFVYWRWDTRSFWLATQDGPLELTPGDGKWILYTPYGLQRGWMGGLFRSLAIPWLIRQWASRDWSRYSEVHGIPTRKAITPLSAQDQKQKDAFFAAIRDLGNEPTVALEQGEDGNKWDVELLEAKADTYEGIKELKEDCDTAISIRVLGQNLSTEVKKGGSRAATRVHEDIKQDIITRDAVTLATTLHNQGLKPLARYNEGNEQLAPYPCWDVDPAKDRKAEAEADGALATAILTFRNAGVNVDVKKLLERADIPVMDGEDVLLPMPVQTSAPAKKPPTKEDDEEETDDP